jgi:MFS transporter, MHS family, shikimate and dehydroshikimate transport protein
MTSTSPGSTRAPSQRRLMLAGLASSTIEYYDFLLYGTMSAIVFNQLFFPQLDAAAGTLAAFGTFAFGFIARPIGSIVLGRLGDRIGRKRTLVISLTLMGIATVGVGLMPTYATIGIAAPVVLVTLRFLQGFALGGEWAGASLLLVENAQPGRKNLMASIVQMGSLGLVLSTLVTSVTSRATGADFATWGWRVPFLVSFLLFALTFWLRRSVEDGAEYTTTREETADHERLSVISTLRTYWKPIVLGFFMTGGGVLVFFTITTYGIAYAIASKGFDRTAVLNALTLAAIVYTVAIPIAGWAADRMSARTVLLTGFAFAVVLAFPFFALLQRGVTGTFIGLALYLALSHAFIQAPQAAVYSEQFPPLVRYTGTALSHALPTAVIGGTAPAIAQYLFNVTGSNEAIAMYIFAMSLIAAACAVLLTRAKPVAGPGSASADRRAELVSQVWSRG